MSLARPEPEGCSETASADARTAAALLAKLGRWSVRRFTEALRPIGLKPRHFRTLLELRAGPLAQRQLGDVLGVDATQLVGFLNELEGEGLIRRRRDPDDRRRHIVEISALGRTRLDDAGRALADVDERLLAGLDAVERARFVALLDYVASHGAHDDADADESPIEPCLGAALEADDTVTDG